jgi:hypothetical protein
MQYRLNVRFPLSLITALFNGYMPHPRNPLTIFCFVMAVTHALENSPGNVHLLTKLQGWSDKNSEQYLL